MLKWYEYYVSFGMLPSPRDQVQFSYSWSPVGLPNLRLHMFFFGPHVFLFCQQSGSTGVWVCVFTPQILRIILPNVMGVTWTTDSSSYMNHFLPAGRLAALQKSAVSKRGFNDLSFQTLWSPFSRKQRKFRWWLALTRNSSLKIHLIAMMEPSPSGCIFLKDYRPMK